MATIQETCSVCRAPFDVQFRYQMEEREAGFSFYCSQRCLERSQVAGSDCGDSDASCDACAKRFSPDLVSQVFYLDGRRRYACSPDCRSQVIRELRGVRLGEIASGEACFRRAGLEPSEPSPVTPSPASVVPITQMPNHVGRVPAAPRRASGPSPNAGPRRIAVFNHKGGTAKTTTAVSLAAGLARKGHRVLLVDTDAQGNVAVSLGARSERSLYHVLVMGLQVHAAVTEIRPNLDLLPSNETLAAAELYLAGRQNRDRVLRERLHGSTEDYDYVVLDCSPSLSLMNQNALVFADSVLVPVGCDYLSLVGVRQVIKTIKNVNSLLHHPVQIWGVLPTFFDARAKICHEAVATLQGHFKERCLSPIRAAIKVKEAPSQGKTIFEYGAQTAAAEDYERVVDRVIASRTAQVAGQGGLTAEPVARGA